MSEQDVMNFGRIHGVNKLGYELDVCGVLVREDEKHYYVKVNGDAEGKYKKMYFTFEPEEFKPLKE